MNAKTLDPEKERDRCREKARVYRLKYPDRVKASQKRQRAKPDYNLKQKKWRAARLERQGKVMWTEEQRSDHCRNLALRQALTETPEMKAARMAGLRLTESRNKAAQKTRERCALFWSITSPEGEHFRFKNLSEFVRENGSRFGEYMMQPVSRTGITRLEAAIRSISPRRKHPVEQCHGWRWSIRGEDPLSLLG